MAARFQGGGAHDINFWSEKIGATKIDFLTQKKTPHCFGKMNHLGTQPSNFQGR